MTSSNKRVAVTGGHGKIGQVLVPYLKDRGYEVFIVDETAPTDPDDLAMVADLTDFGQALDALSSAGEDRVEAGELAYIDELIDNNGRMIKFWFVANVVGGEISLSGNPVSEGIVEAEWFGRGELPLQPLFPGVLRDDFWDHLKVGFACPRKLPLVISYY